MDILHLCSSMDDTKILSDLRGLVILLLGKMSNLTQLHTYQQYIKFVNRSFVRKIKYFKGIESLPSKLKLSNPYMFETIRFKSFIFSNLSI